MKPVCLDSSAWIEITHNGANAKVFLKALGDMSGVIVSTITLYEVWKYTAVNADESRARQIMEVLQQGTIVPPDLNISLSAAQLSIRHKTAMADSLIYATALAHKATLWTQDNDFKGLTAVKYFPKTRKA